MKILAILLNNILTIASSLVGVAAWIFLPEKLTKHARTSIVLLCFGIAIVAYYYNNRPSYESVTEDAKIEFDGNDNIKAIKEATKALHLNSNGIEAYLIRARAHTRNGDFENALSDYQSIKRIDANYIVAYKESGDIYYFNLSDYDKAYEEYKSAYKLYPNDNYYVSKLREIEDSRRKEQLYTEILVGEWDGVYGENSNKHRLNLIIEGYDNNTITAVFKFSEHEDNPGQESGSYKMRGELTENLDLLLEGYEWITQPSGYDFININGKLDINKYRIIDKESQLFVQKNITDDEIGRNPDDSDPWEEKVPLSSAILYDVDNVKGYIVNSNYATLSGEGYDMYYEAKTGGVVYDDVISVCSYAPFDMTYNLEGKYSTLVGEIAFDDICVSGYEMMGISSAFNGEAEIAFEGDNGSRKSVTINTKELPIPFELDTTDCKVLRVIVSFPYYNDVINNYYKYFNLINAYLYY